MDVPVELIEAKELAQPALLALPGVTGIGIGMREEEGELFEELAIRVYVEDASAVSEDIPAEVGEAGVSIIEMDVEPCMAEDLARYDELRGGIRIGHPSHGFGTLGAVVKEESEEEEEPTLYGLTNHTW